MMAWEGTHLTQIFPNYHTPNTPLPMLCSPITLLNNLTLLHNFYNPPLALVSTLTPTPWPMVFTLTLPPLLLLPLPTHPQTRKATVRKEIRLTRKARHRLRQRQGHLTPTSFILTSLSRPSTLHVYCHFHGWVTTHGWPSGNGGHHGDACQFMKSRLSEFTPAMLAARTPDAVPNHPGSTNA
jgi:hypothetical protein